MLAINDNLLFSFFATSFVFTRFHGEAQFGSIKDDKSCDKIDLDLVSPN